MAGNIKLNVVGRVTTATAIAPDDNIDNDYQTKTLPATPDDDLYDSVSPRATPKLPEDPEGYLVPYPDSQKGGKSSRKSKDEHKTEASTSARATARPSVVSLYEDLWEYTKQGDKTEGQEYHFQPNNNVNDDPIYDEVESMIPSNLPPGAKIIPVEEPASAYDEVIINDGRYMIPSRQWDSDSDAFESDFDEDAEAPNYFGENLEELYENLEYRKLASPTPRTIPFTMVHDDDQSLKSQGGILSNCLPISFSKTSKSSEKSFDESPLYVDPNSWGKKEPVMPPLTLDLSTEE
ncbi:Hypothetical predicted protein, partial [Paramuricea clavata]